MSATIVSQLVGILIGVFIIGVFTGSNIRAHMIGARLRRMQVREEPMAPYANELLEALQAQQMVPEDWTAIIIVSNGRRAGYASNLDHGPRTAGALRNLADVIDHHQSSAS